MILQNIPLVDWSLGAAFIAVFAVVCVILVLVVYSLMKGDKKKENE